MLKRRGIAQKSWGGGCVPEPSNRVSSVQDEESGTSGVGQSVGTEVLCEVVAELPPWLRACRTPATTQRRVPAPPRNPSRPCLHT